MMYYLSIYNLFNNHLNKEISNSCIKKNLTILMKILIPFTPHLAYECLELLEAKEIKKWPEVDTGLIGKEKIKMAIQINGKTREIIDIEKGLNEKEVLNMCKNNLKIKSKIQTSNIIKTIFVKDRIINLIVKK